jgi:manganese efflux pump family protein
MLWLLLLSGLLAGVDNLQACLAIGLLPLKPDQRRRYAIAFSTAETVAPLLGLTLGGLLLPALFEHLDNSSPLILLLCGLGILALAIKNREVAPWFVRPGMMIRLPLLLSVDNLLAGIGLSAIHAPVLASVLIIGATGAAMSCAGLYLGASIRAIVPRRLEFAAGVYLCLLSIGMLMKG